MTPAEKREAVAAMYRTIIGRNNYSQSLRDYCYKKYSNGKYYSDCSSSICYTYKECGLGFGILNTVGIINSSKLVDVPVTIKNGQIVNPEILRVGDMLLYAGNDSSRKPTYVGHVEMVGEVIGGTVWLFGHGSGLAKRHEMTAYNRSRYNTKASTPLGNRGLIRVRRFILDDATTVPTEPTDMSLKVKSGNWYVRKGPGTSFGAVDYVPGGVALEPVSTEGWLFVHVGNLDGFISLNALNDHTVKPGTWNIRSGPSTRFEAIAQISGGTSVTPVEVGNWRYIYTGTKYGWISDKALEV